ncbi:MAG: tRNA (N(6)-L-threonylcarbamoyladenosine(37)-C(2))-methylthiotransferase MtaB [Alphaproteobacteria bacterium]|nr:tRNA (N(6)-L-threonylcarbamoyladenosine(37)-C(2))-methylthiotransferase MtaB [Alphaproteobacteria bacterium]
MKKGNLKVVSFGCRLNTLEGEIIKQHIKDIDFDLLVINSCGVTNEAERQLRQFIRKEKRLNPSFKVVLTGCASEINRDSYEKMPEVDYIIPAIAKLDENIWSNLDSLESYVEDMDYMLPPIIDNFTDKQRAYVQIQNGCDQACTYCATRLARGKAISFPPSYIVKQIDALKKYNEIVLTGVNISSYNYEGAKLKDLIEHVLDKCDVPRLRLSSLDIADIDDDFIQLIEKENRIMSHFHFSLQSGDNTILNKMARRHTKEEVLEKIEKIRAIRPDATFGADIITGFPTETEEMFENSVDVVRKGNIAFLHVFPYSEKQNTVAAKMKQIEKKVRKERAKRLRRVAHSLMFDYLKTRVGKTTDALIEGGFIARADDYSRIVFDGDAEVGSIQKIRILEVNINNVLRGELCSES